jgi:hypothetical protein
MAQKVLNNPKITAIWNSIITEYIPDSERGNVRGGLKKS